MLIYRYKQRLKEGKSIEQEKRTAEAGREEGQATETEQETKEKYEALTVPELKEIAKEKEIEGYSNMKKDELVNAIKEGD